MGWGIGNDFNKATGAATPRYAAATQAQGRLDANEQARIDAIRSGNMTGAAEIGNAYMDSPEMQAGVKGFFGGTPTAPVTMGTPAIDAATAATGLVPDAALSSTLGGLGGTAAEVGTGLAADAALGTAAEVGTGLAADAASSAIMSGIPATLTGTAAAPVAAAGAGAAGAGGMMAMMTNPITAAIAIPALLAMLRG